MSTHPRHLDKYELRELLGRGGMAEVWKAYDSQLQRYVAIKLLHADLQNDPDFLNRFVREARVIASLHHPNIVQVYDFQTTIAPDGAGPAAYIVMEYLAGPTLAAYIRQTSRQGRFPSGKDLVNIFAALSRAIDYAHANGMVHRDIKPANILLDTHNTSHLAEGEPILSDFGIARLIGASTGTLSQTWMGTPLYLSPEQAQGQPGNERSDIYSLGVILYEMCTGTQPFRGESVPAIILQQISATPTPPEWLNPRVTPALARVIKRGLAKDPAERFPCASSLTRALAEALNQPLPADLNSVWPALQDGPRADSLPVPTAPATWQQMPSYPPDSQVRPSGSFATEPVPDKQAPLPTIPAYGSPSAFTPPKAEALTPVLPNAAGSATTPQQIGPGLPETPPTSSRLSPPEKVPWRAFPHHVKLIKHPWITPVLLGALLLLILGASTGGIYGLAHRAVMDSATSVGNVFFASSSNTSETSANGENDNLVVNLHNLQTPASGKAYYAWMLKNLNNSDISPILLGKINVNSGNAHFQYTNPDHINLLANNSSFLVTEEDANNPPNGPTIDHAAWRYSASIPQVLAPQNPERFSLLDHLRHLLAQDPKLASLNLPGGLDIWLFRNTEKVLDWSGDARDYWTQKDAGGIRSQVIRVLDYLDGNQFVQLDTPPGTPILANPRITPVALLEIDQTKQSPPGYLYHINIHLHGIVNSPGVTPRQSRLATNINTYQNNATGWLQQVRQYARQLVRMSDADLLSPSALNLLDSMEANARYAFAGKFDPASNSVQGGVIQIYNTGQQLATMNVTSYRAS